MPDSTDRPIPGPHALVVRAAFVPDGDRPPPEFMADFDPLRLPATLDPVTGEITCANAGSNLNGDVLAEWYPDNEQGSDSEDGSRGRGDDVPEQDAPGGGSLDSLT